MHRFLKQRPLPISYRRCRGHPVPGKLCTSVLAGFGGIRFTTKLGAEIEENLSRLEDGLWKGLLMNLNRVREDSSVETERMVADFVDDNL